MPPTIEHYHAFHSMACSPATARECCESFAGGVILFRSSSSSSSSSGGDYSGRLTPLAYYLLVLISMTGLSTVLGLTDCVARQEFDGEGKEAAFSREDGRWDVAPLLCSIRDPAVRATPEMLSHIARKSGRGGNGREEEKKALSGMRLRRKFEYDFRLVGLNVIMMHVATTNGDGGVSGRRLHLMEVYRFRNRVLAGMVGRVTAVVEKMYRASDKGERGGATKEQ